jgi:Uncharacterised nucleotidyltransferase
MSDIVALGLPDAPTPEPFAPDPVEWEALRVQIFVQRVTGLAVGSVESGWLRLDDDQREELLVHHRAAMTWSIYVEQKLVRLADLFDEAGIRFAVLKGASVAHTVYAEPCLRSFGDVDLLVPTSDYERACALLDSNGHVRQRPEPRPHFEVRFGKASVHKDPTDDIEVDLHRTLVLGPFGLWIDPQALLDRVIPFSLGGRQLPRLDDTGMFVNVAAHAALGWEVSRLTPLRDMAELAYFGEIDERVLDEWAQSWQVGAVLRHAANELERKLHVEISSRLQRIEHWTISPRERRLLRAYSSGRRASGTAVATLVAIPSLRAKIAYLWALTVPNRGFIRARATGGSGGSYLRRWHFGWRTAGDRARLAVDHPWAHDELAPRVQGRSEGP